MSLISVLKAAQSTFEDMKSKSTKQGSIEKLTKMLEEIDSLLSPDVDALVAKTEGLEKDLIVIHHKLTELVKRNLASSNNLDIREKEIIKSSTYAYYMQLADIQTSLWITHERLDILINKQIIPTKVDDIYKKVGGTATGAKKQFEQSDEYKVLSEALIYSEGIYRLSKSLYEVVDQLSRGCMQSVGVLNKELLNN